MRFLLTLVLGTFTLGQLAAQELHHALSMTLDNRWSVGDGLGEKAFLVSLQGLANREAPNLYFVYPPEWPYSFPGPFKDYLSSKYQYEFEEISGVDEALDRFRDKVKGYVVWDGAVRTSLIVSFTTAGLEDAVVVSEDLIPLVEKAGIPMVEDFRGRFTGWSDDQIYSWAHDAYWDRVSHDFLIYIGGPARERMEAGIADMAVMKRAFATDLSADPADTLEYQLGDRIFGEMNPWAFVLGWHSYGKDLEGQYITQMSRHTLRQEGLNTFPNMSFLTHIKLREGYRFKNHHNVAPDSTLVPEAKVYLTCVQTDGLGLGAWFKPGRGEIPYAWETADGISLELFPVLQEFYYETAKPNDYFIGALSGPNYMYPKPI
ncbi:MAG: GxGYxYP domain-containing protein, partial [Rhodothermales bacterium]